MSGDTKIDYLQKSWSPLRMLCTPVSAGCDNCWHRRMWARNMWGKPPAMPVLKGMKELCAPMHWRKPQRVGVQFMGDLLHADATHVQIGAIFHVMENAPQHTYFVLTKRPERLADLRAIAPTAAWYGTSLENEDVMTRYYNLLLHAPGKMWLSCEPLLGPLAFHLAIRRIGLVVVGSESGPGRRPCRTEWVEAIVEQCKAANVPVYVKQIHDDKGRVVHEHHFPRELP